ncbi:hypothetical protein [Chryseobacterium sp. MMS23-Vi53]
MKSLKEFIAENLENPIVPVVQENVEQTKENKAEDIQVDENLVSQETIED